MGQEKREKEKGFLNFVKKNFQIISFSFSYFGFWIFENFFYFFFIFC